MKNRHTTIYYNKAEPLNFCGKVIGFQANVIKYEIPFEIEPTKGEHDFTTCEICQKQIGDITEKLTLIFEGNKQKIGFPFCCDVHKGLLNFKEFNRADFVGVPKMIAKKIIYTNQHIDNNLISENWYKLITDYIDWAIDSFGKLPNITPLYLEHYFNVIIFCLHEKKEIEKEKKTRLLEYLNLYQTPTQSLKTDFNILLSTYEKWFKLFPFEISFFSKLKPQFEKQLPILNGEPEINMYSGKTKVKIHTKSSLIDALLNLTDKLIKQINPYTLYEKGLLTEPKKIKIEMILNEMKIDNEKGYTSQKENEEEKYRDILKKWFNRQKRFIDEIIPLVEALPPPPPETKTDKLNAELVKYGFFELPKVKQLSEPNKQSLVEMISTKPMPYGIAMFDELGFCDYLDREQGTKYKADKILSRLYNKNAKDGTSSKHYRRSLIKPMPRYKAGEYKENVKIDYQKLK